MATSDNAQLLALSGPRNPYPGTCRVVAEGALADLLLVDRAPLTPITLIKDPATHSLAIRKDGQISTNLCRCCHAWRTNRRQRRTPGEW